VPTQNEPSATTAETPMPEPTSNEAAPEPPTTEVLSGAGPAALG
jgi:hypothetical protein